jgi:hypothetical protein
VEAYVLAGLKPDAVGRLCEISPAAAANYANVFFDVAAWLPARDAVMSLVLRGRRRDQPSPDDEEFHLKLYGVYGGPLAVAAVRDYYDHRRLLRVQPADLSPEQRRQRIELLRVHVAVLARCLGPEASALKMCQELAALAGRLEDEYAKAVDLTRPLLPSVSCEGLLSGLPPRERAVALEALARPAATADRCA